MIEKPPKLIFPQEIEVWYILPAIRKKVALKLVKRGLSQKKVADIMGVTEAAVSQYKKSKRAKVEIFDQNLEEELEKSIQRIIDDEIQFYKEVIRLNELIKKMGLFVSSMKSIVH